MILVDFWVKLIKDRAMQPDANIFRRLLFAGAFFALATSGFCQTWIKDASLNWGSGSNWSGGTVPDNAGASATLGSIITAARTITVNNDISLGTLTIDNANNYTLSKTGGVLGR